MATWQGIVLKLADFGQDFIHILLATMDSDIPSPNQESNEQKAEFRKLTNEATIRKYRRHSPVSGSSAEDESPKRDHISRGTSKTSYHERRNYDKGDDMFSGRSQRGRNNDTYGLSSNDNRHDDSSRCGKYANEDGRNAKPSDRLGRESRVGTDSDSRDRESDYNRSKDRYRDGEKYPHQRSDRSRYDGRHGHRYDDRDRYSRDRDHYQDERREYRSSRDYRGDRKTSYVDSTRHRGDFNAKKESGDMKELDSSKYKSKNEGVDVLEDRHGRGGGRSNDKSALESVDIASKRPKFSYGGDNRKEEHQNLVLKKVEDLAPKVSSEQGPTSGADLSTSVDAAKVAAIRAAQLVNQNLTSTGFMTADQKKKLLWGNKTSTTSEESSHRWDTSLFSDRDRQEKFNKLMGVKGEVKVDTKPPSSQDAEKQRELQLDLEKQYTAGLRRRDGRTVGLGL
ncbi:unnamed protein product [Amaranthus hypochondriacus]